jgi:hypothetical protein
LICAPPESPSEEARKIYYHADGADDNTKPAEESNNRHTTRSTGAASSSSSKESAKKSSPIQPHVRPEIHIFSSKSRITEDSDNEIIELSSPDHNTKSRAKKRPLPDIDEVVEVEARGKRTSLRPLFDSDEPEDENKVVKKVKKGTMKKPEASAARTVKKNDKRAAEAVRGKRGGRAGGCGGKVTGRMVKSKAVITDSSSAGSDPEVAASDPAEAPLAPRPRPKPRPAYKTAGSIAKTAEITTSATADATSMQPPTDVSTESSLTAASETSTYPAAPGALPASQQVPVLSGTHEAVSAASTPQGPSVNPIPSVASMQVIGSGPPQTLPVASAAIAPPVALQRNFFEDGLLPAGEGPQAHTVWDPRLPYTDSPLQRDSKGSYAGY